MSEVLYILIQAQERFGLFLNINNPAEGHWSCGWSRSVAFPGAEFCPPGNIQKQVNFLLKITWDTWHKAFVKVLSTPSWLPFLLFFQWVFQFFCFVCVCVYMCVCFLHQVTHSYVFSPYKKNTRELTMGLEDMCLLQTPETVNVTIYGKDFAGAIKKKLLWLFWIL